MPKKPSTNYIPPRAVAARQRQAERQLRSARRLVAQLRRAHAGGTALIRIHPGDEVRTDRLYQRVSVCCCNCHYAYQSINNLPGKCPSCHQALVAL